MLERIAPEAGLALMSGHFGHDLSKLPMDKPLEKIDVSGSKGILESVIHDFGAGTTLAEAGRRYGCGLAGLRMYGSPRQIADQMEEAFDAAGDGFMVLSTDCLPGSVDDFVDLVVPQLQERGLFRRSYEEGTLRQKVFGKPH
jgi:alkanesulfonate monooxygenase SsuD/methylene tetrahydromethanopterin reductase-like flavin-dependent oxidoreductase (luciferase family)